MRKLFAERIDCLFGKDRLDKGESIANEHCRDVAVDIQEQCTFELGREGLFKVTARLHKDGQELFDAGLLEKMLF
jgi:hypothetical protein